MTQRNKILLGIGLLTLFLTAGITAKKKLMKPRGIRNNNPGNIRLSDTAWQGKIPNNQNTDREFEQFIDMVHGIRASIINTRTWINRGKNTVRSLISTWSPPNENNTEAYIKGVVKQTGFTEYQTLHPTKAYLMPLVKAISLHENGQQISNSEFESAWSITPN